MIHEMATNQRDFLLSLILFFSIWLNLSFLVVFRVQAVF